MSEETTYPNQKITINSATINKDGSLNVNYDEYIEKSEDERYTSSISKNCEALVHGDLKTAFKKLVNHVIHICDLREIKLVKDITQDYDDATNHIDVQGFKLNSGKDGVELIATKKIGQKVLKLSSPITKFFPELEVYPHAEQLHTDVQDAVYEVERYLEGKAAVIQMEIGFGESDEAALAAETESQAEKKLKRAAKKLRDSGVQLSVN